MINRTLIESRLSLIIDLVGQLDSLAESSESDFLSDPETSVLLRLLRRWRPCLILDGTSSPSLAIATWPKEYKTIAQGLGTLKVVPREFVSTLIQMAGYRNRMVHFFLEITPSELYQLIIARRGDLRRFVDCCVEYLDKVCG